MYRLPLWRCENNVMTTTKEYFFRIFHELMQVEANMAYLCEPDEKRRSIIELQKWLQIVKDSCIAERAKKNLFGDQFERTHEKMHMLFLRYNYPLR